MERRIETKADLAHHIDALVALEPRFGPVADGVGEVPLRRLPGGLSGLLRIVMGQQLSVHAAAAVWTRLEAAAGGAVTAAGLDALDDDALRTAGLSRQKVRTLRAVVASGVESTLAAAPRDAALREALIAVPGIGPWTADLYLLVCTGAPDVFPAGDLALRKGAAVAFALEGDPGVPALEAMAAQWSPHRAAAARLLWAYYRQMRPPKTPSPDFVDDRAPV